jgi:hypothetical protein
VFAAGLREPAHEPVRGLIGSGIISRLAAGVAEHHALVTRAAR